MDASLDDAIASRAKKQSSNAISCHACGQLGHIARSCPSGSGGAGPRAGACYSCGQEGHRSFECPSKAGGSNTGPQRRVPPRPMAGAPYAPTGGREGGLGTKKVVLTGPGCDGLNSAQLKQVFDSDGFRVVAAEIELNPTTGRNRGYVTFQRYEDAERAVAEFHGAEINGGAVNVRPIADRGAPGGGVRSAGGAITVVKAGGGGSRGTPGAQQCRIKVDNLPADLSDADLQGIFASVGGVIVDSKVHHSGRGGRPWGVVLFEGKNSRQCAERAVSEFNLAQVNGVEITVILDPRQP